MGLTTKQTRGQLFTLLEENILELLKQGYCQKEIATKLHCSIANIKTNVRFILVKLRARNVTQAVVIAIRQGYLNVDDTDV